MRVWSGQYIQGDLYYEALLQFITAFVKAKVTGIENITE
jgi:hypothetical protein